MTEGQTDSTLHLLNASTIPKRHRVFSFSRILAITSNTLTELTRLKIFYVLLVFGLLLIGSSIFMAQFSFRSEEHTSELQSRFDLVCRLLLEKKKEKIKIISSWMCTSHRCGRGRAGVGS